MNRLLACTAIGLFMGLTPALAQTDIPEETQTPPAMQQPADPADPSAAVPMEPAEPGDPIPDQSSEMAPSLEPGDAAPPAQSTEAPQLSPSDDAAPPAQSSEAPQSISPDAKDQSTAVSMDNPQFLNKQEHDDWLASNLIGKSVVNAENESIGGINDLVTDESGKIVAVLIGAGGFFGLGEKDVAIRFEDLKLARDENNNVTVMADISHETLASAPDYELLDERDVTVGATEPQEDAAH